MGAIIPPRPWPYEWGKKSEKDISYLNMLGQSAARALSRLWSDTFLTNAGIDGAASSLYTYRGTPNFDVIRSGTGIYNKALLHFEDLTESQQGLTVTAAGGAAVSPTQKKFGTNSLSLDGASKYVYMPDSADWQFAGDFTIEAFVYMSVSTGVKTFISQGTDNQNYMRFQWDNSSGWKFILTVANTGVVSVTGGDAPVTTNTWYHIAIVRSGNTWTIYRDGVQKGTANVTYTYPNYTGPMTIGREDFNGSGTNYFNGYIDEVRISTTARYTTTPFTPPAAEFPVETVSDSVIQSVRALDLAANVTQAIVFAEITNKAAADKVYVSTDDGVTWTEAILTDGISDIMGVPAGKQLKVKITLNTANAEIESWGVAA